MSAPPTLSCTRPGLVLDMSRTLPKCPIFTQKGPLSMDAGHLPDLTQCVLGGPDTIRLQCYSSEQ